MTVASVPKATAAHSVAEFAALKGSARGRKVFIFGTGPSVRGLDLSRARDDISITVNFFGAHPDVDDLAPDFHILADPDYWNDARPDVLPNLLPGLESLRRNRTRLVMPGRAAEGSARSREVFSRLEVLHYRYGPPLLPVDFSREIPTWGQNVLNVALMLALHLDPTEVYLVGFDNGGLELDLKRHEHFYPETQSCGIATSYTESELERCMYVHLNQLHALRRELHRVRLPVFTCAADGTFRMFPFRSFEDATARDVPGGKRPDPVDLPPSDPATVHGRILVRCQEDPTAIALHLHVDGDWTSVDRRTLAGRIERYRTLFASLRRPGEIALFLKRTDLDLLAAYLGAMAAGMVPAQMSPPTTKVSPEEYRRRLDHILRTTGAEVVFADAGLALPGLDPAVVLIDPASAPRDGERGGAPSSAASHGVALAQFSSGTTGLQKAVFLRHEGILAHMDAYAPAIGLTETDTLVSWLPLYHDMGLIAGFLLPLVEGVPLALMDPFAWIARPELMGEAAERFGGTVAFLPNFAYHVLATSGRHRGMDGFRLLVNCSEPARPGTHRRFLEAFPGLDASKLSVCWAMAENTFAVSQTPPGQVATERVVGGRALLSCGRVVPGTEVRVLEPDADGIGELAIRGATLFHGFLDGEDRLVDGFYPTGDLGAVLDGEVYVAGRKKDILIVRGKNVHPQDVEHAAGQVEGVRPGRVVCFGVDSELSGSEEMVVLVEGNGKVPETDLPRAVGLAVEAEVGLMPGRVVVVPKDSLVKTSSGKISRSRNKELHLQGSRENPPC